MIFRRAFAITCFTLGTMSGCGLATDTEETASTNDSGTDTSTEETQSDTTTTDSSDIAGTGEWGEESSDLPEYFPSSDVPQSQVDLIKEDYGTASAAWGNFGPLEFWIIGTDVDAANEHDSYYCTVRMEKDPGLSGDYRQNCLRRGHNFEDYARDGGAGLNTIRNERDDYSAFVVTLASKYPFPNETDYTVVTYHEYFHVYQHAHIFTRDDNGRRDLMIDNPWWAEGGAEYMAQLLYSRQPGVDSGYLKDRMTWKMESKQLLNENESFTEIPYGERGRIGYDLGSWFIAYLIDQVGEEPFLIDFFDDLNTLGWEGSFVENFGMSSQTMLEDFEIFLTQPLQEQLAIIP